MEVVDIWNDFHKELKSYIAKTIHNEVDADDVMQEVFVKIIRNIHKVNKAENLRQYLYGIVRNTINDYFKTQQQKHNNAEFPVLLLEDNVKSLNTVVAERVKSFIDQLPEKYKEALLLTEFQDVSQKDLAERLNISYSGAKSRVQRGKEKLKEQLMDCCIFQSDVYGNIIEMEKKNCHCS